MGSHSVIWQLPPDIKERARFFVLCHQLTWHFILIYFSILVIILFWRSHHCRVICMYRRIVWVWYGGLFTSAKVNVVNWWRLRDRFFLSMCVCAQLWLSMHDVVAIVTPWHDVTRGQLFAMSFIFIFLPIPVAMVTKFETKWTITCLV